MAESSSLWAMGPMAAMRRIMAVGFTDFPRSSPMRAVALFDGLAQRPSMPQKTIRAPTSVF